MEEDRGGVLVGGHRRPEREVPQVLNAVRPLEVGRVARHPEAVPLRELLRAEGRQPQQVVAAVLHQQRE